MSPVIASLAFRKAWPIPSALLHACWTGAMLRRATSHALDNPSPSSRIGVFSGIGIDLNQ
jgi:hypothetical protein